MEDLRREFQLSLFSHKLVTDISFRGSQQAQPTSSLTVNAWHFAKLSLVLDLGIFSICLGHLSRTDCSCSKVMHLILASLGPLPFGYARQHATTPPGNAQGLWTNDDFTDLGNTLCVGFLSS